MGEVEIFVLNVSTSWATYNGGDERHTFQKCLLFGLLLTSGRRWQRGVCSGSVWFETLTSAQWSRQTGIVSARFTGGSTPSVCRGSAVSRAPASLLLSTKSANVKPALQVAPGNLLLVSCLTSQLSNCLAGCDTLWFWPRSAETNLGLSRFFAKRKKSSMPKRNDRASRSPLKPAANPGRRLAKSADPAYIKFTTYVRKSTHLGVKTMLVSKEMEFSELVEELLATWLKQHDAIKT